MCRIEHQVVVSVCTAPEFLAVPSPHLSVLTKSDLNGVVVALRPIGSVSRLVLQRFLNSTDLVLSVTLIEVDGLPASVSQETAEYLIGMKP